MQSLPIGTKVKRKYDELIYEKMTFSDDLKRPCEWRSRHGPINVSDTSIQKGTQFEILENA